MFDNSFMDRALEIANMAASAGQVPVGAVVVRAGRIVGEGGNLTRASAAPPDPTGHAEIVAIREAARTLGQERLGDCDLWVTLEPCAMCAGAIAHARMARVYYGAADAKGGAVESGVRLFEQPTCLHRPEVYSGIAEERCAALLRDFFGARR